MELTPSQKKTVRHQFDSFCRKVLREEARDYERHIAWRSNHEVSLSELSEEQERQMYVLDEYPSEQTHFHVRGYDVAIENENLANALTVLPDDKRDIVLLAFFLDMTDQEIADKLDMVRRTVQYKRAQSLKELKKEMEVSFVIMGVAGIGKSTVVKHIMLSEYMKGTKILCIDPESEYKDMCRNLNGSWLNAGGGKNGRSNLLQIRPAPRDDDDETDKLYTDEGNGMSDMALHMKTLEIEFSLYLPSLTDMQKAILKQTIIELYNQFGIFWETDIRQLKATDFPILSDLHALLEKKAEANKENPVYRDLAMLLYDAAAGSDSFLWNGHTTLEANSRFICLDTHDLQNASDNVKRTQYLNLLSWCWEEMSRDRNERCLLVCDEAYLMIDPQVPQSLVFLRNVEKRARKYEAGLAIISHSVVDFLAPEVKMYGQALLDIPCYKILMGCDGKNLQETKDLYNLTDAEQELLESKRRGHALFIIGSKRLHVNFEIPAYKFSYMGKAGGR